MDSDNNVDKLKDSVNQIDNNSEDGNVYTPQTAVEIEELLKLANIDSSEVAPIVQHLYTYDDISRQCNDYKILELDDHLLQALESGESLSFRGAPQDEAVICSSSRTYEVKEAETSNTCLLVPNMKLKNEVFVEGLTEKVIEEVEIKGAFSTYLEIQECFPRLNKLQSLLEQSSYKGKEYEKDLDKSKFFKWECLQGEIQASDSEILAVFPKFLIVEIDGYYRLVAFEFVARALPLMLDVMETNSWAIDEVDKEITCECLEEIIIKPVFDILFQKFTEPSLKKKEDGSPLYKYNEAETSRLLANILLKSYPINSYDDFMTAWKMGCPDSIVPKEEYLYGIAIVVPDQLSIRKEIRFYPETNLPDNLNKRLNELFRVKKKWTMAEITPYIEPFVTRNQDVNAILTKHARVCTVNDVKYYSAKHGR